MSSRGWFSVRSEFTADVDLTGIEFANGASGRSMEPRSDLVNESIGVAIGEPSSETAEQRFDRILRLYGPALSRLAYGYEKVAGPRDELVQEIALAIWQALPHFRGECSERTFIYRIAHNRGLTHVCKRRPESDPIEDLPPSREPVDPRPHPEEQVAFANQRHRLWAAIQRLPLVYRQVIMLMLEDLSHAEIADVLGITETNVAVRLNRARKALKESLEAKQ
jgi:RNA polymerase sigma factor (sigma-70 family)